MQNLQNVIMVGLGGFLGSILRYLVAGWTHSLFKTDLFPIGTLMVNIIGCLVIGLLGGWADQFQALHPHARLLLFLGLLGGFTTFSAFGYETMALLRDKEIFLGFINISLHLLLGLGAVLLGYNCSKLL